MKTGPQKETGTEAQTLISWWQFHQRDRQTDRETDTESEDAERVVHGDVGSPTRRETQTPTSKNLVFLGQKTNGCEV